MIKSGCKCRKCHTAVAAMQSKCHKCNAKLAYNGREL